MKMKLFIAAFVLMIAGLAYGKGVSVRRTVDLSDTDSTYTIYFSGSTTFPGRFPGGSGGWSLWLKGSSSASATITTIKITEMDTAGDVSDASADWTTLTEFSSLAVTSSTVRHEALGTLDYCAGVQVEVTIASGGSGIATMALYFGGE